jgi:hypothetical protein
VTPFGRVALLPVAGAVLTGCGAFASMAAGTGDDLSTWSRTPLPPDAGLAAKAVADGGACRMDDPTDNITDPAPQVLIQDRRTQDTAAFLVASATHFGDCMITRSNGASGGGYGPPLGPTNEKLTIDSQGSGGLGAGGANVLGGRLQVPAVKVVVILGDNRAVTASVANGFWLAWWPNNVAGQQVIAFAADGTALATLKVVNQ